MGTVTPKVSELMMSGATIYRAPIGTTVPAKTLGYGEAWPVGWENVGLTSTPALLAYDFETESARVQQALADVARSKAGEGARLETLLAQVKNANAHEIAAGGGKVTSNAIPGVGTPAYSQFDIGGVSCMDVYMWGLEGKHCDEETGDLLPVRAFIWRGTVMEGYELTFDLRAYAEGLALMVGALEDIDRPLDERLYQWYVITAPAT